MPIDREQFDKELDQLEYNICEFLKGHPEEAYQVDEVADDIVKWQPPESRAKRILYTTLIALGVEKALDELARKGLVDKKTKDGKTYYCIHK